MKIPNSIPTALFNLLREYDTKISTICQEVESVSLLNGKDGNDKIIKILADNGLLEYHELPRNDFRESNAKYLENVRNRAICESTQPGMIQSLIDIGIVKEEDKDTAYHNLSKALIKRGEWTHEKE